MGLFNNGKISGKEQEVLQRMMHSELMDIMIGALENEPAYQFAVTSQRGDTCARKVIVRPYFFLIEVPGAYDKGDESHSIAINFQKSGYSPLSAQSGISCSRMCYLYATALQRRLQELLPNCRFEPVSNIRDLDQLEDGILGAIGLLLDQGAKAEFKYHFPAQKVNSLF